MVLINSQMRKTAAVKLGDEPAKIVIPLWPYRNSEASTDNANGKADNKIKRAVLLYGLIWLSLAIWAALSWMRFSGGYLYINAIKGLILLLLPLFAWARSTTHITFSRTGIHFEKRLPGNKCLGAKVPWSAINEINLIAPPGKDPRSFILSFKEKNLRVHKIKLARIATSENWQKILKAIEAWSPVVLAHSNPMLLESRAPTKTDPTYTSLWLEALSAPPRRSCLTPLNEGNVLKEGTYRILARLGSGGQGTAYLCLNAQAEKVVLKEYILPIYVDVRARKHAIETFQHETIMLSKLDHPLIVKLLDSFVADHRAYLVLEYIEGPSLKQLVESGGPLKQQEAARLALMMCEVLTYLHNATPPVVHRDFTPDNLILGKDGALKLIDFMIAQQSLDTSTATIIGKHCYLSPEQFKGKATIQSDLYGLGATLFFLLTGLNPEPLSPSHPIIETSQIEAQLDHIVAKCTDLSLATRYQQACQIKDDLEHFLAAQQHGRY